jgi:hypothetical protein
LREWQCAAGEENAPSETATVCIFSGSEVIAGYDPLDGTPFGKQMERQVASEKSTPAMCETPRLADTSTKVATGRAL